MKLIQPPIQESELRAMTIDQLKLFIQKANLQIQEIALEDSEPTIKPFGKKDNSTSNSYQNPEYDNLLQRALDANAMLNSSSKLTKAWRGYQEKATKLFYGQDYLGDQIPMDQITEMFNLVKQAKSLYPTVFKDYDSKEVFEKAGEAYENQFDSPEEFIENLKELLEEDGGELPPEFNDLEEEWEF